MNRISNAPFLLMRRLASGEEPPSHQNSRLPRTTHVQRSRSLPTLANRCTAQPTPNTTILMKANVLAVSLVLAFSGMTFAGNEHGIDPSLAPPPMIPPPMPVGLFGPGWQGAAHALYLMPGEDTSDNVFGGGLNLDHFVDRNVGFQAAGSWADPGTDDLWHNYTVDVTFRAPMQNFAPTSLQAAVSSPRTRPTCWAMQAAAWSSVRPLTLVCLATGATASLEVAVVQTIPRTTK